MNYDALIAFGVFAEHLNFTHAARALHLSQPALHAKVAKLADELELTLYVRRGRSLVLTDAGRRLAAHARQVTALTDDVLAELRSTRRGPVCLATGQGAFMYVLGSAIQRAQAGPHPLRLMTLNSPDALLAIEEARAHVAVGVFHSHTPASLEITPLREVGQMVVMPEHHPLAEASSLHPRDLHDQSLIIAPEGMPHRISTAKVLDAHDVPWEVAVEATGWQLMMNFVSYGLGVTIINDHITVPPGLVGIPIEGFPTFRYDVAILKDTPHEGARWLRDLIVESVDRSRGGA